MCLTHCHLETCPQGAMEIDWWHWGLGAWLLPTFLDRRETSSGANGRRLRKGNLIRLEAKWFPDLVEGEKNTARTLELVLKTIGQVPLPSDNLTYSSYSQSLFLKGKSTINGYKRPSSIAILNSRAGFPTKTNPVGRWQPTSSSGGASLAVGFRTQVSTWPSGRRPTMVS